MSKNKQIELFDTCEEAQGSEPANIIKSINVTAKPEDNPGIRRLKKNFNYRLKTIGKLRADIEKLPKIFSGLNLKFNEIVKPTEKLLLESKLALIETIDKAFHKKSFSKMEHEQINEMMLEQLNGISEMGYDYDEKYQKYYDFQEPDIPEESKEFLQEMAKKMMGVDVDIEDMMGEKKLSPEDFEAKYGEEMRKKAEAFEKEQKEQERKKKEQAGEADKPDLDLHFMKTYKNLAKKIHPDLEQDAEIRKEKELLMKELSHAKDNRDLFQLISIKIKVENIENNEVVLDENYLKLYAERLLEQKEDLERDIFIMKRQSGTNSWLYQNFYARHSKTIVRRLEKYRDEQLMRANYWREVNESIKTVKGMKQYIQETMEPEDEYYFDFFDD
ncbi:MAG TPA: hypothetical protein VFM59_06695 [Salinimicrobium sp.]|nr:hypothetical protein [Salinimicrobium sp.]